MTSDIHQSFSAPAHELRCLENSRLSLKCIDFDINIGGYSTLSHSPLWEASVLEAEHAVSVSL